MIKKGQFIKTKCNQSHELMDNVLYIHEGDWLHFVLINWPFFIIYGFFPIREKVKHFVEINSGTLIKGLAKHFFMDINFGHVSVHPLIPVSNILLLYIALIPLFNCCITYRTLLFYILHPLFTSNSLNPHLSPEWRV
jgi:hypothetical protein